VGCRAELSCCPEQQVPQAGGESLIATAIRSQKEVVGPSGRLCRAWEFDYHMATFYIQETDSGYVVVEETRPRGAWMPVQSQRSQMVLAEFEHARRQYRR
jgi:hypothetical protein